MRYSLISTMYIHTQKLLEGALLLMEAAGKALLKSFPLSTAVMSKSEFPKEPEQLWKLFIGGLSFETTEPF